LTDFAFSPIHFKAGSQSANYRLTADNVKVDTFTIKNAHSTDDYMQHLQLASLINKQSVTGDFTMPLPTSLRTNIDWHIARYFFVNTDALISFRGAASKKNGT